MCYNNYRNTIKWDSIKQCMILKQNVKYFRNNKSCFIDDENGNFNLKYFFKIFIMDTSQTSYSLFNKMHIKNVFMAQDQNIFFPDKSKTIYLFSPKFKTEYFFSSK